MTPNYEALLVNWMQQQYPGFRGVGRSKNGKGCRDGIKTQVLSRIEPCESCGIRIVVLRAGGRELAWYSPARVFYDDQVRGWRCFWDQHTPQRCRKQRKLAS